MKYNFLGCELQKLIPEKLNKKIIPNKKVNLKDSNFPGKEEGRNFREDYPTSDSCNQY